MRLPTAFFGSLLGLLHADRVGRSAGASGGAKTITNRSPGFAKPSCLTRSRVRPANRSMPLSNSSRCGTIPQQSANRSSVCWLGESARTGTRGRAQEISRPVWPVWVSATMHRAPVSSAMVQAGGPSLRAVIDRYGRETAPDLHREAIAAMRAGDAARLSDAIKRDIQQGSTMLGKRCAKPPEPAPCPTVRVLAGAFIEKSKCACSFHKYSGEHEGGARGGWPLVS